MSTVVFGVGILYFVSRLFTKCFDRFQVPDVLLLMLLGIVLGPLSGSVSPESFGNVGFVLSTITLTIILFESGTDISLQSLKRAAGPASALSFPFFFVTLILGAGGFFLCDRLWFDTHTHWAAGLVFGAIVAGTSSAVVIPLVNQLKPKDSVKNALVLESALTDVLCIVFAFAFIGVIERGGNFSLALMTIHTSLTLVVATIWGVGAGLVWVWVWRSIIGMKTSLFTTIAFALVVFGFAELVGVSGAISALVFGLTLANYDRLPKAWINRLGPNLPQISDAERSLYRELVFLLKTFFFIFLGINMSFESWQAHVFAFLFLVVLFILRFLWCRFALRGPAYSSRDRWISSLLVPKGLAAAVLASIPAQKGIDGGEWIEALTYAIVLQSILFSSTLIMLGGGLERGPPSGTMPRSKGR